MSRKEDIMSRKSLETSARWLTQVCLYINCEGCLWDECWRPPWSNVFPASRNDPLLGNLGLHGGLVHSHVGLCCLFTQIQSRTCGTKPCRISWGAIASFRLVLRNAIRRSLALRDRQQKTSLTIRLALTEDEKGGNRTHNRAIKSRLLCLIELRSQAFALVNRLWLFSLRTILLYQCY